MLYKNVFFVYIKLLSGCYQINKQRLQKKARERYQGLSEEEKNKKRQYAHECY